MLRLLNLYILTVFFWINVVQCDDACEFSNINYKDIIQAGVDGKVKSSDPLHVDFMKSELPGLKYSSTNNMLIGMKDCDAIHVQCDKSKSTFQYYIQCPHLVATYSFEAEGKLLDLSVQGHGTDNIELEDYVIMLQGNYETVVGTDQKARPSIKKFVIDTDPRGSIKFNVQNQLYGDKERDANVNKILNDNWRELEKLLRTPFVDTFMDLFVQNFNAYSKLQ